MLKLLFTQTVEILGSVFWDYLPSSRSWALQLSLHRHKGALHPENCVSCISVIRNLSVYSEISVARDSRGKSYAAKLPYRTPSECLMNMRVPWYFRFQDNRDESGEAGAQGLLQNPRCPEIVLKALGVYA